MIVWNQKCIILACVLCVAILCAPVLAISELLTLDEDGPWYLSVEDSLPVLIESELTEEIRSFIDHPRHTFQIDDTISVEIQDVIITSQYASVGLRFHVDSDCSYFVEDWQIYDKTEQEKVVRNGQSMICIYSDGFINKHNDIHGYFYGFGDDGRDYYVQVCGVFGENRIIDSSTADVRFRFRVLKYDGTSFRIEEMIYLLDYESIIVSG